MDLILGNRTTLKQWLLPETWQAETQRDGSIDAIGLGVAQAMEGFCNRKFGWVEDEQTLHPANEAVLHLARFPIDAKPTVEFRGYGSDTWEDAADAIAQWRADIGQILFDTALGTTSDLVRITATGGYWTDTTEDESGVQPDDSTLAPSALVSAWQIQCRHLWTSLKLFGDTGETAVPQHAHLLGGFDLLPVVKVILNPLRRFTV
jgi:hypothetical protein